MAAAQILNLTHRVDNKVTDVGIKLKDVDDKMGVVVQGMPRVEHSFTFTQSFLRLSWLDGKDVKVALQKTSNNVDDVKCS
jgi:hypothetical protein